ncbi:1-(5-phosphoribosyl)-5-[(5-phosphoribosylamino)methylideneamino]imidazole-4-carboxamide isomerase [Pseudomonadota bacterium]
MKILPAIDLRKGKCVRLMQGDFSKETTYSEEPVKIAKEFEKSGAKYLHLVNLDGAKGEETSTNLKVIKEILKSTNLKVEVGGGIKTKEQIENLFKIGVEQVIIGSLSVKDPKKTLELMSNFGRKKVILSLDVNIIKKEPYVTVNGWQKNSSKTLWEVIEEYNNSLKYVLCTDISRDGVLGGVNMDLYKKIVKKYPYLKLIASGGVATLEELKELRDIGTYGTIIGKAIYENKLNLTEIFEEIQDVN